MPSPIPNMPATTKITTKDEEKILQRRIKDAARKRKSRLILKQQCPLKHQLFNEKNRARKSEYDEMKRSMRDEMTKEELIADKKCVAEAKRIQRKKKSIAFFGWDNEKTTDHDEEDKSPSS
jgi:hypothetical protein